jgi:hypothetical protein
MSTWFCSKIGPHVFRTVVLLPIDAIPLAHEYGCVVQEHELPLPRRRREVVREPRGLRAAAAVVAVENDEVHVAGVERVVPLLLRAVPGEEEHLDLGRARPVRRADAVHVVVPERGEERDALHRRLVVGQGVRVPLGLRPVRVDIVADGHDDLRVRGVLEARDVRLAAARVAPVADDREEDVAGSTGARRVVK